MSTRPIPSFGATRDTQQRRTLETLGFPLVDPTPAAKPSGQQLANLSAPTQFHVCILGKDDYIAVTKLRGCTGLALYDSASKLGGMYHFGGQFGAEPTELDKFAGELSAHHVELGKLQMWLVGSTKCGYADKLLGALKGLGFTQTPVIMEINGMANPEAEFYLLGTGAVTNQLV